MRPIIACVISPFTPREAAAIARVVDEAGGVAIVVPPFLSSNLSDDTNERMTPSTGLAAELVEIADGWLFSAVGSSEHRISDANARRPRSGQEDFRERPRGFDESADRFAGGLASAHSCHARNAPASLGPLRGVNDMLDHVWDLLGGSSAPMLFVGEAMLRLNQRLGGRTHEDLRLTKHRMHWDAHGDLHRHDISVSPTGRLGDIYEADLAQFNGSGGIDTIAIGSHLRGIARVAPGWRSCAHAPDGLVEAIEPFIEPSDRSASSSPLVGERQAEGSRVRSEAAALGTPSATLGWRLAVQWPITEQPIDRLLVEELVKQATDAPATARIKNTNTPISSERGRCKIMVNLALSQADSLRAAANEAGLSMAAFIRKHLEETLL